MSATRRKQPDAKARIPRSSPPKKAVHLALVPTTARVIGYARVSTEEQNLDVQLADFERIGAQRVYVEKISATNAKRPQFNLMMKCVEQGDTVYFHSISRLCRGVEATLAILRQLKEIGVSWKSLTEPYCDDLTAAGKFMTHMTVSKDEHELNQLSERTQRGMDERKRQGMWLGRKAKVSDADAWKMVSMRKRGISAAEICRRFRHLKIKPATVYARTNALMKKRK